MLDIDILDINKESSERREWSTTPPTMDNVCPDARMLPRIARTRQWF
jgi:hypothetical protein